MLTKVRGWAAVAVAVTVTVGAAVGAFRAARAEEPAPRFAAAMPRGALVFLEARDLSGLLGAWLKSPTRDRYFQSASYRSFKRSRLYVKLQERLTDLQKGFGVDITDERLAEIAGGPSAIAIYDPGKLEVLVATEVPREKALASTLFAQAKSFEERKTAKGTTYYAREVSTDGGSLVQRIAFGYSGDRLWVGTSEALVAEAIDGPQNGGLGPAVGDTIKAAGDFAAHDMLVWFDMERTVRNKYFNLYWIQRNAKDLEGIVSGIIDLEFAADGVHERRWFVRREAAPAGDASAAGALAKLRAMAPPDAQLVEAKVADAGVAPALAETVFGPERGGSSLARVAPYAGNSTFDDDSSSSDDEEDARPASGKYRVLDGRFDRDVDDPAAQFPIPAVPAVDKDAPKAPSFAERVAALVGAASPVRYATFASVRLPEGRLFADFDRAVVVELAAPDKFDGAAFEAMVREEFGRRFLVGGDATRVVWSDAAGSRSLAGALVGQGGAYRVVGPYLVVARDAAACSAFAERAPLRADVAPVDAPAGALARYAEVRVAAARDPFVRLTRVLDSHAADGIEQEVAASGEAADANRRPVLFFSENVASLLDVVRELDTVRIATTVDGAVMRERVDYVWAAAAPHK